MDAALADALPTLDDDGQSAAVRALARRGRDAALAQAMAMIPQLSGGGRAAMLANLSAWRSELWRRIAEGESSVAVAALGLIEEAQAGELADLTVRALELRDTATRAAASSVLRALVGRTLGEPGKAGDPQAASAPGSRRAVTEALLLALRRWPIHRAKSVIVMALEHPDEVLPVVRSLVGHRRSPLTVVLQRVLEGAVQARFARWCLLAMSIDTLAPHAVRGLSRVDREDVFRALVAEADVLADEGVRRGLRHLRRLPFLTQMVEQWARWSQQEVSAGLALTRAMGLSQVERLSIYAALLDGAEAAVRGSLLDALLGERGSEADRLLRCLAIRDQGPAGRRALEAWRRRVGAVATPEPAAAAEGERADPLAIVIWRRLHTVGESATPTPVECDILRGRWADTLRVLRASLANGDPEVRRRAVVVSGRIGAGAALATNVGRLCHDVDAAVRAAAVALLDSANPSAKRLLRAALNDSDARVRAGAVEACARTGSDELLALVRERLADPDRRVRANAIGALLPRSTPRAAVELLDMLGHAQPSWRRSALWVVRQLDLRSQETRLVGLAEGDEDSLVRRAAGDILARWHQEPSRAHRLVAMPRNRAGAKAIARQQQGRAP